jgi:hypothetical protein
MLLESNFLEYGTGLSSGLNLVVLSGSDSNQTFLMFKIHQNSRTQIYFSQVQYWFAFSLEPDPPLL